MRRFVLLLILLCGMPAIALSGPITSVPTDLAVGDTYYLAFVTSFTMNATSSDIAVYDAFVQAAADAAAGGLENITWLAIGSISNGVAAISHTPVSGPVYRLDNTRIADDQTDLWDGSLAATLSINELGNSLLTNVWTGTQDDGQEDHAGSGSGGGSSHGLGTTEKPNVAYGRSGFSNSDWIWQGLGGRHLQTNLYSVYGISEAQTVPIPEPSTLALFGLGFLCILGLGYQQQRRKKVTEGK